MGAVAQRGGQAGAEGHKLPVVQAGLIKPLFEYASNGGANTQVLLRRARLPGNLMDEPHRFVPAAGWFALFTELVRESGQADLGWRVADAGGLEAYNREFLAGIFRMPTLLEAWRFIGRNQSRHCNTQFFQLRVIGEFCYIVQGDTFCCPGFEQRNAFRTANILTLIRLFLGDEWKPDLIVTQAPLDVLPVDSLEGTRVVHRRSFSAVRVPRAQMIASPKGRVSGTYSGSSAAPSDTPGQIRRVLQSYSLAEMPSLRELASLMNTSARSLQRQLREQHTSYKRLAQEASFEHARELLESTALRITDVAHQLGYDDSSHFSRMFRSVSGVSPREYRRGFDDGLYPSPASRARDCAARRAVVR